MITENKKGSKPKKKYYCFNTAQQVRSFLSMVANKVYHGDMEQSKAKTLTYIANHILMAMKTESDIKLSDLEKKIKELEERL